MTIHRYTRDTMGRLRRVCPTCHKSKFPGKAFRDEQTECFTCIRERIGVVQCKGCGSKKRLDEFPSRGRKKNGELNLWRCRECTREYQTRWAKENPDKVQAYQRKYQTGVELEQMFDALERAGGRCEVCRDALSAENTPHADHDHKTGRFRGVLCRKCNIGLGMFADEPGRLRAAATYLEKVD